MDRSNGIGHGIQNGIKNRIGRIKEKRLLIKCIAIPLILGAIAGLATGRGMEIFAEVNKPPLSPPGWLFPVVWTILYILMGISSYLVAVAEVGEEERAVALTVYALQLAVNFLWPFAFFSFQWYLFAFFWLVLLWLLVRITIGLFLPIAKTAAYLLFPYLIWLTFAGYLNLGIWYLNR